MTIMAGTHPHSLQASHILNLRREAASVNIENVRNPAVPQMFTLT